MVQQLRESGRFEERVLKAIGAVPRHLFVEEGLEDFAYKDTPVAIGAAQTISQPSTVALETQLLNFKPGDRILEIGTGCGYQSAVLFYLGAEVFSIERQAELFPTAVSNLEAAGYLFLDEELAAQTPTNINSGKFHLYLGDGYLGLPAEVILMLLSYCIEEQERRLGEGRRPTMRMVEKEAYFWARSDIFTLDAAEEYIKKKDERRKSSYEIRELLGIKNHRMSATEEKYITSWLEMGFTGQAISMAYDRTVLNKKELVWPYMNRIMESWHKKGLHSAEEIEAGDRRTAPARQQSSSAPTDEEYERMRRYVDKLGGGDDGA